MEQMFYWLELLQVKSTCGKCLVETAKCLEEVEKKVTVVWFYQMVPIAFSSVCSFIAVSIFIHPIHFVRKACLRGLF